MQFRVWPFVQTSLRVWDVILYAHFFLLLAASQQQQQPQQVPPQQQQPRRPPESPPAAVAAAPTTGNSSSSLGLLQVPLAKLKPKIYSENSFIVDEQLAEDECLCEVCCDLIDSVGLDEVDEKMSCKHKICSGCWKRHFTAKLQHEAVPIAQVLHTYIHWGRLADAVRYRDANLHDQKIIAYRPLCMLPPYSTRPPLPSIVHPQLFF